MPRFLHLFWRDKGAALEALCCVLVARGFLLFVPFRKTAALTARAVRAYPPHWPGERARMTRLSDLIRRVSRYVPGATCLTQALALKWMLTRRRIECHLRIGVTKNAEGVFKAHAWLETTDQRVLIGGSTSPREYVPLKFDLEKAL